ncbi:MAG: CHASE3 domain-containing protein [Cytophagaceae bacterium]|nr:CHASE3 domain-containing protein [Cytophagaceae bacterium]
MKLSAFQSLKIGFSAAIIVLLLSLVLNYKLSLELQDNVTQTEKRYTVIHEMDKVLYMQSFCEGDVRGFLVTRDNHFVTEYYKNKKILMEQLHRLNQMQYSTRLIEYNDLVKARIKVMDDKLNLASSGKVVEGDFSMLVNKGRVLTDSIVGLKNTLESYEMKLLSERAAEVTSELNNMKYVLLFCALAAVAMGLFTVGIMKKYVQEKQKRLDELQELDKNKNKFFSIISHDLRAPVYRLVQLTKMMSDSYKMNSKEDLSDMISLSRSSSIRIKGLLDNLLTWGKIQMERIEFNPEEVHVFHTVEKVISDLKDVSRSKRIELVNSVAKEPSVYADSNMLKMVLRNLIHNAVKYSNPNSEVIISTIVMNGQVEILVRDFGIGMEKEFIDQLMKMESVYSRSGTASEEGSGLALIICKEFIEKNNGVLSISSQPGVGTIASVTFSSYTFKTLLQYDHS